MSDIPSIEDKLLALKASYISSLPEKFDAISQLWQGCKEHGSFADNSLESCLHKLAGSAGMYDEAELGEICRSLELMLTDFSPPFNAAFSSEVDNKLLSLENAIDHLVNK
ncbi:MAG: Hpt domain-containing protein [Gammaproteobacteria bacterium]|nr:Hpt domain-containing protein [Gammaproteobacteria bacterium]